MTNGVSLLQSFGDATIRLYAKLFAAGLNEPYKSKGEFADPKIGDTLVSSHWGHMPCNAIWQPVRFIQKMGSTHICDIHYFRSSKQIVNYTHGYGGRSACHTKNVPSIVPVLSPRQWTPPLVKLCLLCLGISC